MSWSYASHTIWLIVLIISVSAQQQPQAPDTSAENAATRQPTVSSQPSRSIILGRDYLLRSVNNDHLAQVRAASAIQGSLETLAAQLDADDDLVSSTLMQVDV
jgi:hypothetical protein